MDPARATVRVQALLAAGFGLGKGAVERRSGIDAADARTEEELDTQWDLVFNLGGVVAAALYLRAGFVDRHLVEEHEGEYQGEHPARAQPQQFL